MKTMKLYTKKQLDRLLKNRERIARRGPLPDDVAPLKIFDPTGRYTYYAFEAHPQGDDLILFGFCVSSLGEDGDEWGYTSLNELAGIRKQPFGLGLEREIYFTGVTRADIEKGERP